MQKLSRAKRFKEEIIKIGKLLWQKELIVACSGNLSLRIDRDNILITTHTKPDGDACGSVITMYDVLTAIGKKPKLLFLSEIPE